MSTVKRLIGLLLVVWIASAFSARFCYAQTTETWDNGSGNFTWDTTSLNWSGSAWTDGNSAEFDSTGAGPITVSGTRILGNLTVTSTNYSFTGGALNITNDGTAETAWWCYENTYITSAVTAYFPGNYPNSCFEKDGVGNLYFYGPVTMTGNTTTGSWLLSGDGVGGAFICFYGNLNLTNVALAPFASSTAGNIYIGGGTNILTGTVPTQRGIICLASKLWVGGGNITSDRLMLGDGSGGDYLQTNGTVTITGTVGLGGVELGSGANVGDKVNFTLNGGTFIARGIWPNSYCFGTSTIRFNGGVFQCYGNRTNLFYTDVPSSQHGSILIGVSTDGPAPFTNGATIDTAGFTVIQRQSLLAGSPSGGLTKLGAGTLDLASTTTNTYTGATTVSNGTLLVDGSLAAGSAVYVAEGTLGGSGTINGTVLVDGGGVLAPGSSALGTLTVNNNLTLNSGAGAVFRLNTMNAPATNDSLVVTGTQSITAGTLTVVNLGPALHAGDSFTLLNQATAGFTTVNLPAGYTWANKLALNGSIQVLTVVPSSPTNITYTVISANQVVLSWPSGYGWRLQAQTNTTGLSTNWFNVTGAAPPYTNNINLANPTVFYRLVYP